MVPLQSKSVWGIVWKSEILDKTIQTEKIKPIKQVLPFKLQIEYLEFLKLFSRNTFNSINISGESLLQPLKLLTNKNWQELEVFKANNSQLENADLGVKNTINISSKTSLNKDKQPTSEYFA
ncbi:MAG: hypothetical protein ACKOQ2_10370, partial [Dolichospermum sp.]